MKKITLLLSFILISATLFAAPIGEKRAREIATSFFAQFATRSAADVELVWAGDSIVEDSHTGSNLETSLMYIYKPTGNGFVIVAGDSNVEPIIAYSLNSTIDTKDMAEATIAILDAWCKEIGSAREAARPISEATRSVTRSITPLIYDTALWNQGEPFNREAPVYNGERSVTGCVATAMSIICYYHQWPTKGVGTTPEYYYYDPYDNYREVPQNVLGREYKYSQMLSNYNNGYTEAQANAVAALMKDMGTSVKMMYHPNSSGAYDNDVVIAFATYFGYARNLQLAYGATYSAEEWADILRGNVRDYGPTFFSGLSDEGGHAFVVDGYDAEGRFHFNFGWGGTGNGYFYVPNIEYYRGQTAILRLTPDRNGISTYSDNIILRDLYNSNWEQTFWGIKSYASSYSPGELFICRLGGFFNDGIAAFNGDIKLVLCDKYGTWKEELYTQNFSIAAGGFDYCHSNIEVTITTSLEVGDRLRIYYKGEYSDDWLWARSVNKSNVYDELLVMASPEDIAKGLTFIYEKNAREISIYSQNAAFLMLYNADTGGVIGNAALQAHQGIIYSPTEDIKNLNFEIFLGAESYFLTVKL